MLGLQVHTGQAILHGFWGWNSVPHACEASSLLTGPSLQSSLNLLEGANANGSLDPGGLAFRYQMHLFPVSYRKTQIQMNDIFEASS